MQEIHIEEKEKNKNKTTFLVKVAEDESKTIHTVHVQQSDYERLAPEHSPEELVWASFLFLLDRESKESIIAEFNLMDITKYFPEYEEKISEYL